MEEPQKDKIKNLQKDRQKVVVLICSENRSEEIEANQSEQIETNWGIPEKREFKSEEIGRKQGRQNKSIKSEQIGITPFCQPQIGGSEKKKDVSRRTRPHQETALIETLPSTGPRIAIPLACYRIGFGPLARNRKKKKTWKNLGFGRARKNH